MVYVGWGAVVTVCGVVWQELPRVLLHAGGGGRQGEGGLAPVQARGLQIPVPGKQIPARTLSAHIVFTVQDTTDVEMKRPLSEGEREMLSLIHI